MLKCIHLTKLDYFSNLSSEHHKSQYINSRNSNDNHASLLDALVEFTVMHPVRRLDAGMGPSGAPFHRRFSIVAVRNLLFRLVSALRSQIKQRDICVHHGLGSANYG